MTAWLGWLGAGLVLAAYLLLAEKLIRPRQWFHGPTGIGSLLLVIHNWGDWPMVILSSVFALASWRWLARSRGAMF